MVRKYEKAKRVKLTSGEIIRNAREMLDMTQAVLANKSMMRQSHLSEIERGKRPVGAMVAKRLGKILDLSPSYILFAENKPRQGTFPDVERAVKKLRDQKREVNSLLTKALHEMRAGNKNSDFKPALLRKVAKVLEKAKEVNDDEDIMSFYLTAKKTAGNYDHR